MRFEAAAAAAYSGTGYDLVTMFDCLHDMGDPVGAARHVRETLEADGTWMIVEPQAGDRVEDNLNPVGRAYYAFSTLLCTPASLSQDVGLALGAQAGRGPDPRRRHSGRVHPFRRVAETPFNIVFEAQALTLAGSRASAMQPGPRPTWARYPDAEARSSATGCGSSTRSTGTGEPTVLLLPTWSVVSSRIWKMQIPYLARHVRVVAFDGRGNGRSDRPPGCGRYRVEEFAGRRPGRARRHPHRNGRSSSPSPAAPCGVRVLAADHPERVTGIVYIGPAVGLAPGVSGPAAAPFRRSATTTHEGWAKYNRHYWLRDWPGFLEFFFTKCFTEPHSTKQIEDAIGWGSRPTRRRSCAAWTRSLAQRRGAARWRCARGSAARRWSSRATQDAIVGPARGAAVAEAPVGARWSRWKAPATCRTCATRSGQPAS